MDQPKYVFRYGEECWWSTWKFDGTIDQTRRRFFSTELGRAGAGFIDALTRSETNVRELGRISGSAATRIRAVSWMIWGSDIDTVENLWLHGSWGWDFTQTFISGSPLAYNLSVFDAIANLPDDERKILMDLQAQGRSTVRLGQLRYEQQPIHLPANAVFSILMDPGCTIYASTPVFVRFTLQGEYTNAIGIG